MTTIKFYFTDPTDFLRETAHLPGRVAQAPSLARTTMITLDLESELHAGYARMVAARTGGVESQIAEERLRDMAMQDQDLLDTLELPTLREA